MKKQRRKLRMMALRTNKGRALIEAGQVQRFHTTPVHMSRSIGEHSWNMAALLFTLHPEPPMRLVKAVLFHDVAERWTGDIPAPAKWSEPVLNDVLERMEQELLEAFEIKIKLDEHDTDWLKALDILELTLHMRQEMEMGNKLVARIYDTGYTILMSIWVPTVIKDWFLSQINEEPRCPEKLEDL